MIIVFEDVIFKIIMHVVEYCYVKIDSVKDFYNSFHDNVISETFNIDIIKFAFKIICEKDILTIRTALIRMTIAINIVIVFLNHDNLY